MHFPPCAFSKVSTFSLSCLNIFSIRALLHFHPISPHNDLHNSLSSFIYLFIYLYLLLFLSTERKTFFNALLEAEKYLKKNKIKICDRKENLEKNKCINLIN